MLVVIPCIESILMNLLSSRETSHVAGARQFVNICRPRPTLVERAEEPPEGEPRGERRRNQLDAEVEHAGRAHDEVVVSDALGRLDLGEKEGVKSAALWGIGRIGSVTWSQREETAGDTHGPEPHAVRAHGKGSNHPDVCSEAAKERNGSWSMLGIETCTIAPDAEDAEDGATAEMHEDQAVHLTELSGDTVIYHGDEKGEQENRVSVEGAGGLGRKYSIGGPGLEPGKVDTEANSEAIVVGGSF